jgi:hypothetical protein
MRRYEIELYDSRGFGKTKAERLENDTKRVIWRAKTDGEIAYRAGKTHGVRILNVYSYVEHGEIELSGGYAIVCGCCGLERNYDVVVRYRAQDEIDDVAIMAEIDRATGDVE